MCCSFVNITCTRASIHSYITENEITIQHFMEGGIEPGAEKSCLHRPRHAYLLALPCILFDRGVDLAVLTTEENVSDDSDCNDETDKRKSYLAITGANLKEESFTA